MYYKEAAAICLVYDNTKLSSFTALKEWMKEIEVKSPENVLLVLVGNKCDLTEEEEVSIKEGTTFAKKIKSLYI